MDSRQYDGQQNSYSAKDEDCRFLMESDLHVEEEDTFPAGMFYRMISTPQAAPLLRMESGAVQDQRTRGIVNLERQLVWVSY